MVPTLNDDSKLVVETAKNSKKIQNHKTTTVPVEVEYWHVLPALRRSISTNLKKEGLKQKEIANILGITEAGVSQYLKGSRGGLTGENGKEIAIPEWLAKEIISSCKILMNEKIENNPFLKEMNRLLILIRENPTDFLCKLHTEFGSAEENCDICMPQTE